MATPAARPTRPGIPQVLANNESIADLMKQVSASAAKKVADIMTEGEQLFSRGSENDPKGPLREKGNFSRDAKGNLVFTNNTGDQTTLDINKNWGELTSQQKIVALGNNNQPAVVNCLKATDDQTNLADCVRADSSNEINALRSALILQKLGFNVVEKNTTLGKLKLVESVDNWLARNNVKRAGQVNELVKDQANPSRNQIGSDALNRLRNMVELVNRSPSILNKGWKPPKDNVEYKSPKLDLPAPSQKKEPVITWMSGGSNVEGEVSAINNVIKADSHAIKLGTGLQTLQHGGGSEYRLSLDQFDDKTVFALQSAYNDLKYKLETKGKKLDASDQKTIEDELVSYNKLYRKVLLSIELMKAMNDMVSKGLITKDQIPLQEVYDKQDLLVKKSEDKKRKLMVILGSLGSAVAVEVDGKTPSVVPSASTEIPVSLESLVIE
jgi:hypothetical protein